MQYSFAQHQHIGPTRRASVVELWLPVIIELCRWNINVLAASKQLAIVYNHLCWVFKKTKVPASFPRPQPHRRLAHKVLILLQGTQRQAAPIPTHSSKDHVGVMAAALLKATCFMSRPSFACAGPCWSMLVYAGPCWSLTSPTNQLLKKNGEKQNFFVSTCFYLYVDMQHSAHDFQLLSPGCSAFPTILVVLTNTCPAQEVSAASGSIRRAIGLARIISSAKLSSCSRSSATWEMHRDDIRKVGWRWLEQVCKSWNSGSGTVNAKRGHGEYRCVCVCPLLHKRFQQNVWICVNACVNARKNHCSPA